MQNQITLLDLLKIDQNISIIIKRDKLDEIRNLIKSKFGPLTNLSKAIGFSQNVIYAWLNGRNNTRLKVWMEICKLLNIQLEGIIEKVVCMKRPSGSYIPIDAFPVKKDAVLASLVGHAIGDGHINSSDSSFGYTNKCEELLNEVEEDVGKLPIRNIKVINNRRPNKTPTLVFSTMVGNILICAGAPAGNKITHCYELPEWIKNGSKEIKCAFIKSLFDDEGNVSNSRIVRITMSKRVDLVDNLEAFFRDIESILESLGVNNNTIRREKEWEGKNGKTTAFTLQIFGFLNFQKFSENIQLSNTKKRDLLKKIALKPKTFRLRKGETKRKIIDLIKNNPLTIDEITNSIKCSWRNTMGHLNELESKNLITRTKPKNLRKSLWHSN